MYKTLILTIYLSPSLPFQITANNAAQTNGNGAPAAPVEGPKMLFMSHDELVFSSKPGTVLSIRYSILFTVIVQFVLLYISLRCVTLLCGEFLFVPVA